MGLFFYTKIGSIRSIGDLPTTNIIEPTNVSASFLIIFESTKQLSNLISQQIGRYSFCYLVLKNWLTIITLRV